MNLESVGQVDDLKLREQIRELKLTLGLKEDEPFPKEDPSELELEALYQEIGKALS